eukprot:GILK01003317.1.p2 GENE.GILK01003317.1~~GILK01003317.1.p2  ORF type:complete len:111 (+),score=0.32 GILK01003317.1:313-645(+)
MLPSHITTTVYSLHAVFIDSDYCCVAVYTTSTVYVPAGYAKPGVALYITLNVWLPPFWPLLIRFAAVLDKLWYDVALKGVAIVPPVPFALTFSASTPLTGITGTGVVAPV